MRYLLLIIGMLLIHSVNLLSQPAILEGYVPGAAGKCVRLYTYADFVSYSPLLLAKDTINHMHRFRFQLPLKNYEVKVIYLTIERYKSAELLIRAGKHYVYEFDSIDFTAQDRYYSPLASDFPRLMVHIPTDTSDFNYLANILNGEVANFSFLTFPHVVASRNKKLLDNFKKRLDSLFAFVRHPFMKQFIEYTLAELEFISGLYQREYFIVKYFYERPFLYENPAFMNFFHTFFDKYIYTITRKISLRILETHIVKQPDYRSLFDSLGRDPILINEVVRDMVLIKNIHQMYVDKIFSRDTLYAFMHRIAVESKFSEHRAIANNLIRSMELHKSLVTYDIPAFMFKTPQGNYFRMDTVRDIYTYVFFFTTYSLDCLRELKVLESIYNTYKNDIRFLSVSMDVDFLQFFYFMQEYSFPWLTVNFNKNFELEDYLQMYVYPHAILIDRRGKIVNMQAPLPSEDLQMYFDRLLQTK